MTDAVTITVPPFMARDPLADARAGDEFVYDGASYHYLRRVRENRVLAMSAEGASLEMPDPLTGIMMMPTPGMILDAMRARRFFLRSDPLPDPVRAEARAEEPASSDVWHRNDAGLFDRCDKGAALRDVVVRTWDSLPAAKRPMRTNAPLREWVEGHPAMTEALKAYGRTPAGSTLRHWLRFRGAANDRRAADMPSRTGKVRRSRKVSELVLTIGRLHALARGSSRRKTKVEWTRFKRSVAKASNGEKVVIDGAELVYEKPALPLKPFGLTTFRLECRRARSAATDQARRGDGARRQLHEGGGASLEAVRFLHIVQQDDSPFPNWFLVDAVNRIPVGVPTVVITLDVYSSAIIGWDVSMESPSTSTWLRALAHCCVPKEVPEHLKDDFADVEHLYGRMSKVIYDNALQNVGHAAQDAAGDLAHTIAIAGENEPTHKAKVENVIRTVQGYMREVDGYTLPIPMMRKFGYDPGKHVVATIDTFRKLLAAAIQTYNTQAPAGGQSPLQMALDSMALHGHHQARDVDQFLRSIGEVHHVRFDRNGFEIDELRYTLGSDGNAELLADFASANGAAVDDEVMSFVAKVKTHDTIGSASIFNPKTRRYLPVPCALRRYGTDTPFWLHRKVRSFAASARLAFRTDDQMEDAREAFTTALEAALPEATARQHRLYAAVIDAPAVRRHLGTDVVVRKVPASAGGMAEPVLHEGRGATRRDGMRLMARPKRGGVNVERAARRADVEQRDVADLAARVSRGPATPSRKAHSKPTAPGGRRPRKTTAGTPMTPLRPGSSFAGGERT